MAEPLVLPHTIRGTGPHGVIALHGWFGDRDDYETVLAHSDGGRFTYAALDQRGYGDAGGIGGEYTTARVAADALALADHLGWSTFSVVGHSMGGKVAQNIVALAPERVRCMVGISPVPASGAGLGDDARALCTQAAGDPAARRAIIDLTTGGRLPARWLDRMVDRSLARSDRDAFAAYFRDWAFEDFHEAVEGAEVPALAVAGAHDPALSAEVMRATWMEWFPRGELYVLQDAGHYAMEETPLAPAGPDRGFPGGERGLSRGVEAAVLFAVSVHGGGGPGDTR
ncbi:alpha/beta fold hydrolase [Nocardiopsis alba]|uniref:alpha/beta fold hydrolase n=1 Tax=Nocardiopsis alba TaxID=53437 RepID=UPI0033DF0237